MKIKFNKIENMQTFVRLLQLHEVNATINFGKKFVKLDEADFIRITGKK